jgi:hypothetical protein
MAKIERFEQELEQVNQELNKLSGNLRRLMEQSKKLDSEFDESADSASGLADKIGKVNKQSEELSASEKELIRIQKASEKITVETAKAQIQLTKKRREAKKAAEAQLGVTKKQIPFTKRMAGAYRLAAIQIVAVVAALKGVIEAGKKYVKLTQEVNKQTSQTRATFDLTKKEARELTVEIRKLSTAFDKEYNDVLKSANILSKEFGITGSEAIELVRKGFEKGADINGEFLELLKEYPAQLKSIGLNAEQTIAIITQTEREGVFSDKGIDAIKEAGIRLREMTPATKSALDAIGLSSREIEKALDEGSTTLFEVTQKVSDRLNKLPPQSRVVGTAIADIFGGPGEDAGLRFLQTIKDINLELDNIETSLSEDELATIRLRESWEELRTSSVGTGGVLVRIKNGLADLVIAVLNFRNNFIDNFNDLIKQSNIFRAVISVVVNAIVLNFKGMINTVLLVIEPFVLLGKVIRDALKGNFDEIKNTVGESMDNIKNRAMNIGKAFVDAGTNIRDAFTGENIDKFLIKQKEVEEGTKAVTNAVVEQRDEYEKTQVAADQAADAAKKAEAERKKRMQEQIDAVEMFVEQEILLNKNKLLEKEISEEEFAAKMLQLQIDQSNMLLGIAQLTAEERLAIEQQLVDKQIELNNLETQNALDNEQKKLEARKEAQAVLVDIANELFDFSSTLNDREIANLEDQKNQQLITEEEFARKVAEIKRKQAIANKIQGIFNATINTAAAITKALSDPGGVAGGILAVLYGLLGASQIATIAATPIPQFAEGVTDFEGGRAIVGEEGRELINTPQGTYLSPDSATMVDLPPGTNVIPNYETEKITQGGASIEKMDELIAETRRTRDAMLNRPVKQTSLTDRGLKYAHMKNQSRTEWLEVYIRT